MNGNIKDYRYTLEQKKGEKKQIEKVLKEAEESLKNKTREGRNTEQAQIIIQTVAQQTQEELEYHISHLVSLALSAVFDDPYEFKIEFVIKRGKTEADIYFIKNGEKINPMQASGGGAIDVASFALRIALWSLANPRSNNTIIIDEPFRNLSRDLQPKAAEMMKMLSEKMGIQFIFVTHNNDLIDVSDRIFQNTIKNGVSEVM